MKPPPFAYVAPESLDGVVDALVEGGEDAKVIAGGQSLLPVLALRLGRPSVLVDVGRVPGLDSVSVGPDGALVLGAGVTHATLERHPEVARRAPVLAEAAPLIGHAAIRTRGTLGGSLAHADPAAELPAMALLTGASVVVRGPSGRRTIAAADLFLGYLTTALGPDEVVEEVHVPPVPARSGDAVVEVSRRHGDFALVGAAARVELAADGSVADGRVAFFGVAGTPVLDAAVGDELRGAPPDHDRVAEVGVAAGARLDPVDDLHATAAYRRRVAGVLAGRALATASARAARASGATDAPDDDRRVEGR